MEEPKCAKGDCLADRRRDFIAVVMRRDLWLGLLLVTGTLLLYGRVFRYDFVNYDDPDYVTANADVQKGLTKEGIKWAFTKLHGEQTYWHPVTWLSHMLDVQLFGLQPGWHHLMNVLFHAINVVLVFSVLRMMTGAVWRSWLVAALFAVHPLQVDSVAWITERKNVLSTMFGLLTLVAYVRYVGRLKGLKTLNALNREEGEKERERSTFNVQRSTFNDQASNAEQTRKKEKESSTFNWEKWGWYAAALVFFALGLMSKPALVTLPCLMLLLDYWPLQRFTIAPRSLRITNYELRITHYSALRLVLEKLPFFAMAGALAWITVQSHEGLGMTQAVHGLPLLLRIENALVAYATYVMKAIWPAKLAVLYPHPGEWPDAVVLGSLLLVCGMTVAAVWLARRAPYLFVGWFWFLGVLAPTIGILQIGVQAMADRFAYVPLIGLFIAVVWGGWAAFLKMEGSLHWQLAKGTAFGLAAGAVVACGVVASNQIPHWRNSIALFEHALRVTKNNFVIEYNLGYTLMEAGRTNDALSHFKAALRIRPDMVEAAYETGMALESLKRNEEALEYYERVVELKPDWATARLRYAGALSAAGKRNEAIAQYLALLAHQPTAHTHTMLAALYAENNQPREAVQHYREALRLSPDSAGVLNNLAWLLATHPDDAVRDGNEAVRLAEDACELTFHQVPTLLGTLAAAYAEAGRFEQAVRTGEEAAAMADSLGEKELAARNRKLAQQYREKKAHRQE